MTDEIKNANIVNHRHQTPDEINKLCLALDGDDKDGVRVCRMNEELQQGMKEMEEYKKCVTFYGSARFKEGDFYYERARHLAGRIAKELGFAVVTGGGPGIMEAGNRGAFEAGGQSVGLAIKLPKEQKDNPYLTDHIPFYFFSTRKTALSFSSEVFVYFPGGFGTMDECFEVITLLQTRKLQPIPVILYGKDFWNPLIEGFVKPVLLEKFKTISEEDMSIFTVTDDDDMVLDIIRNAKERGENHGD